MTLILKFDDGFGQDRTYWVRPTEHATFGTSPQADCVIEFDPSLEPIHFSIFCLNGQWTLESRSNHLSINSRAVRSGRLQHGDIVRAGNTNFHVQLPNDVAPREPEPTSSPLEAASLPHSKTMVASEILKINGAVHEVSWEWSQETLGRVLQLMGKSFQMTMILNGKQAKSMTNLPQNWDLGGHDWYGQAPEDIRAEHSLTLHPYGEEATSIPLLMSIMQGDFGMVIASPLQASELGPAKSLHWAWFARPSLLAFHLHQATPHLLTHLCEGVEGILMFQPPNRLCLLGSEPFLMSCLTASLDQSDQKR